MTRQLAAILFSDIVGYTAMMGQDESGTLELVRRSRELQKPLVEKHQGIWLKEMGDGAMAQFKSALDAVRCAVEIQQVAKQKLEGQLRIGIHLGDITIENEEVYGDGVNVASRIESIAEPGSVYISEAIQGAIKGSDIYTSFQGEKKLKNVDHPVRVYKLVAEPETISRTVAPLKSHLPWIILLLLFALYGIFKLSEPKVSAVGKTIAVLPPKLINPDSTNEYLIQGITEELIRSIGKVQELTVINPISTSRFMASVASVPSARSELKQTDYFLTGFCELINNQLILNLQLVDAGEQLIWEKTYQDDISKLPVSSGVIAVEVAEFIDIKLSESESYRITDIPAMDPELLELLLKGKNHLFKLTPEDVAIGMNYLIQATDRHPANSRAWSMLAEGLVFMGHGPAPPPGVWQEAKAAAIRAIQLDSLNAEAWGALAHTKSYFEWDYPGAIYGYHKANRLNPNMAMNHYHYAWHLYLFDSLDKAIAEHTIAQNLDPLDPSHSAWLAFLYVEAGNLDQAMIEAKRSLRVKKDSPFGHLNLGIVHMNLLQFDSAAMSFENASFFRDQSLGRLYFNTGQFNKGMEIIDRLESEPLNTWTAFDLSVLYAEIDSLDKYFHYANYEPAHAFTPWNRKMMKNKNIIADPRFKQLMNKMNLPMPVAVEN